MITFLYLKSNIITSLITRLTVIDISPLTVLFCNSLLFCNFVVWLTRIWFGQFLEWIALVIFGSFEIALVLLGQFQNFQKCTRAIYPKSPSQQWDYYYKFFFPSSIVEWNKLSREVINSENIKFSKKKYFSIFRIHVVQIY